jgi:AP-3 complex subunit beta
VLVLKSLVQSQALSASASQSPLSLVSKLAQRIEEIHHPQAKACVIWLVGQYAPDSSSSVPGAPSNMASWAPDVLRRVTKSFLTEVSIGSASYQSIVY